MRCFIACCVPDEVKDLLSGALWKMRARAPFLKWVAAQNLHFTVKFLGEVSEDKLPEIQSALEQVSARTAPFDIELGEIGGFGPKSDLRVVWIGLNRGSESLSRLAGDLEEAAERIGFQRETRPYRAHLTLGRSRRRSRERARESDFEGIGVDAPPFTVDELVLFRSQLLPEGSIYTKLEVLPFHG
jgi:2'-5' RNA ligase